MANERAVADHLRTTDSNGQDLRGGRYVVEVDGKRIGRIYEHINGAMRMACRSSRHDGQASAIHRRYDAVSKQYVEVGRADYEGGVCVAISGTAKS